jgi:hypothetical protein
MDPPLESAALLPIHAGREIGSTIASDLAGPDGPNRKQWCFRFAAPAAPPGRMARLPGGTGYSGDFRAFVAGLAAMTGSKMREGYSLEK